MYLVFARMPGESYRMRIRSLSLCLREVSRKLQTAFNVRIIDIVQSVKSFVSEELSWPLTRSGDATDLCRSVTHTFWTGNTSTTFLNLFF